MLTQAQSAGALQKLRTVQLQYGHVPLQHRRRALRALRKLVTSESESLAAAASHDFGGRDWHETMIGEIAMVVAAIDHALPRLARWSRAERVSVGWRFWPARARVLKQPLGVVGIIAPWNYPIQLTLSPLVGALAAGCRVIIKPSEYTPETSAVLYAAVTRYLDPDLVLAIKGGAEEAAAMSALAFDKLLFTGSSEAGRRVLRAAADNLVPVALELGGKCPAVIDPSADVKRAAADIVAGKLFNAGQTCVAPDYVLLPRAVMASFIEAGRAAATHMYGHASASTMTAICRPTDRVRLASLLTGLNVVPMIEQGDAGGCPPCFVVEPPPGAAIMQEEIFGPLLPLVPYDDHEEVFARLDAMPAPLALYWFGRDRTRRKAILDRTRSGGVAINDTIMQAAVEALPFGGVGASGMGAYHGRAGFETFTHRRAVFLQSRLSGTRLLRSPYGRVADQILRGIISNRPR